MLNWVDTWRISLAPLVTQGRCLERLFKGSLMWAFYLCICAIVGQQRFLVRSRLNAFLLNLECLFGPVLDDYIQKSNHKSTLLPLKKKAKSVVLLGSRRATSKKHSFCLSQASDSNPKPLIQAVAPLFWASCRIGTIASLDEWVCSVVTWGYNLEFLSLPLPCFTLTF